MKTLTLKHSMSNLNHWVRALALSTDKVSCLPLVHVKISFFGFNDTTKEGG